jgi:hypothetical protein
MRQLPQTNFEEKLSLVYEKMTNSPSKVLKEYSHENAEDAGGSSMRSYIGNEIINAFEGDGVMDIYEFDNLARKYLGGGGKYDDMSQDDIVELFSQLNEIGLDLEVRDDKVYLVDYKDSGEENAEEDSVRRYIEDELVYAFEGDGVMDLGEFIELGKIVLRRPDVANMNLKDFVSTVGDEIGMELEVSGDEVMLVDYKDSGKKEMVEEMLPAVAPIAGALVRGAAMGAASSAVSNAMDEDAEDAEDAGGGAGDFSIGSELFNLYSNLDREARTRSGSLVSEELKMIMDELDDIVRRAEQFGSKFDLIKQLRLD